jgi:hypothetical protein
MSESEIDARQTRCAAKTITGKLCKNVPEKGHKYCWFHCRSRTTDARFYQNSVVQALAGIVATVLVGGLSFQLGPTKEKQDQALRMQHTGLAQLAIVMTNQESVARGIEHVAVLSVAVEERLNRMDTNGLLVEKLSNDVEQLRPQSIAYTQAVKELKEAVLTINRLKVELESAQFQLSSADRQRITNAVTQAERAVSLLQAPRELRIIGGG